MEELEIKIITPIGEFSIDDIQEDVFRLKIINDILIENSKR